MVVNLYDNFEISSSDFSKQDWYGPRGKREKEWAIFNIQKYFGPRIKNKIIKIIYHSGTYMIVLQVFLFIYYNYIYKLYGRWPWFMYFLYIIIAVAQLPATCVFIIESDSKVCIDAISARLLGRRK